MNKRQKDFFIEQIVGNIKVLSQPGYAFLIIQYYGLTSSKRKSLYGLMNRIIDGMVDTPNRDVYNELFEVAWELVYGDDRFVGSDMDAKLSELYGWK